MNYGDGALSASDVALLSGNTGRNAVLVTVAYKNARRRKFTSKGITMP